MGRWSPSGWVAALPALLVLGSLAACGQVAARPPAPRASSSPPSPDSLLTTAATKFMRQLQSGSLSAQWGELAPQAQALWPSEAARSAFLTAKFRGAAAITSFQLGPPAPAGTWVSAEDPAVQVRGGYRLAVEVGFGDPAALQPAGVSAFYATLDLVLLPQPAGQPLVLDEGPASLDAPVIVPANPPAETATVPVLMYHLVGPFPVRSQWNSAYAYNLEYGLTVTTAQFQSQMGFLAAAGSHAISLARLADFLLYRLPLPSRPVAITFDDGRESPFRNAVPILTHFGFTATFFVSTGLVGQLVTTRAGSNPQRYLSWSQIEQLAVTGFWIEDHTLKDNVALWGAPPATLQQLAAQTAGALELHTGLAVQFIAYAGVWPYPTAAQAGPAERSLFTRLAQMGYVGGAVDARVDSSVQTTAGIWQLPRVRMNPNQAGTTLAQWVG